MTTHDLDDVLALYEQFNYAEAYNALRRMLPGAPAEAYDYLRLAMDRIRRDLGEDIVVEVSVELMLNTAKQFADRLQ